VSARGSDGTEGLVLLCVALAVSMVGMVVMPSQRRGEPTAEVAPVRSSS
jgi:hypothetical protein